MDRYGDAIGVRYITQSSTRQLNSNTIAAATNRASQERAVANGRLRRGRTIAGVAAAGDGVNDTAGGAAVVAATTFVAWLTFPLGCDTAQNWK